MNGNDNYIKNKERENQRQENILEYQRKFFKKKMKR